MTRTNLNRSSKLAALVASVFVLLSAVATPVAAVSVAEENVPSEAEVGEQVSATVTLDELYQNPQWNTWSVAGQTNLTDVTWTVTYYDQTGSKVGSDEFDGQNFTGASVNSDDGISEVDVKVTGTVPDVTEFDYEDEQQFLLMGLSQTRDGGASNPINTWNAHHYTAESAEAREAIANAENAISEAGGADTQQAEQSLTQAIRAFNGENPDFDLATELATEAENQAGSAQQSSQTMQMAMYAVGGLVALLAIVGGVFWYRSNQTTYDKLG
ncbi:hypothetical protein AUR64_15165 [Haloprofundus marisrubri]|uniref:Uncharacterized protein n=1 Tax=Haloprofundus marisrubri TaxID=1514971 RepID=A0A0W1R760_9EURY|nr:hypothetical protein [Haloprofundus marisrubri]KTG09135.1 hypothetical protein AUR64_15165 [Haloprofundus marisrubri]